MEVGYGGMRRGRKALYTGVRESAGFCYVALKLSEIDNARTKLRVISLYLVQCVSEKAEDQAQDFWLRVMPLCISPQKMDK